jgi:hypothetical protein
MGSAEQMQQIKPKPIVSTMQSFLELSTELEKQDFLSGLDGEFKTFFLDSITLELCEKLNLGELLTILSHSGITAEDLREREFVVAVLEQVPYRIIGALDHKIKAKILLSLDTLYEGLSIIIKAELLQGLIVTAKAMTANAQKNYSDMTYGDFYMCQTDAWRKGIGYLMIAMMLGSQQNMPTSISDKTYSKEEEMVKKIRLGSLEALIICWNCVVDITAGIEQGGIELKLPQIYLFETFFKFIAYGFNHQNKTKQQATQAIALRLQQCCCLEGYELSKLKEELTQIKASTDYRLLNRHERWLGLGETQSVKNFKAIVQVVDKQLELEQRRTSRYPQSSTATMKL